ncbi:DUF2141 domain-containing protein [Chamaesiphon sp.]|uniref:DUF2141 domain-containing protein n=1 Tax=Chamaesiphon sp. TaxID=2814140 RepID=UPI003593E615
MSIGGTISISPAAHAGKSSLTVTIDGVNNKNGQVCLSLFSQSQGFPNRQDRAVAVKCIQSGDVSRGITFGNLEPGSYAVALLHDANSDGKINTGFLGIPKEGFGFSRNPQVSNGPPSFQDTTIVVVGQSTTQIRASYL